MAHALESLYQLFLKHPVICTDTRKLEPGCLFFALKGEAFNGNLFAAKALEQGAAYAIIDEAACKTDPRCLLVPDVLKTLQNLATCHRRKFDIPLIAIGGSNGKTTTKELVSAVLSAHYPCHFTKGNLNNHIGVPLTLLAMPADTEVAVIEIGANHPGEIDELCYIARPTHGLLTNIGKEHLEGFGSLEGVKKAEGELYRYLNRHHGFVFVNRSEKYLNSMTRRSPRKVIYGQSDILEPNDAVIDVAMRAEMPFVEAAFLADNGQEVHIKSHLYGRHNFSNIMTAIALGIYFKVPAARIKSAIENYQPRNNRSELIQRDNHCNILLDAYNANPSSMRPALQSLAAMPGSKKIAILGDMLELGESSLKEHQQLLSFASKLGLDQLVLVGPEFGQTNFSRYKALHFENAAAARIWLDQQDLSHSSLLLKGSRGIGLERLIQ